jgi:hypothetical protein
MGIGKVGDGPEPINEGEGPDRANGGTGDIAGAQGAGAASGDPAAAGVSPALERLGHARGQAANATYRSRAATPKATPQQRELARRLVDCRSIAEYRAILGHTGDTDVLSVNSLPESERPDLLRLALRCAEKFDKPERGIAFEAFCDALRDNPPRMRLPLLCPTVQATAKLGADQVRGYRYAMKLVGHTAASRTLATEELSTVLADIASIRPVGKIFGPKGSHKAYRCDAALRDAIAHAPPVCWGAPIHAMIRSRADMPGALRRETFVYFVDLIIDGRSRVPIGQRGPALEALAANIDQCAFEDDIGVPADCVREQLVRLADAEGGGCLDSVVTSIVLELEHHRARHASATNFDPMHDLLDRLLSAVAPELGGRANPAALSGLAKWRTIAPQPQRHLFDETILEIAQAQDYEPHRSTILSATVAAQAAGISAPDETMATVPELDDSLDRMMLAAPGAGVAASERRAKPTPAEIAMLAAIESAHTPQQLTVPFTPRSPDEPPPLEILPPDAQLRIVSAAARRIRQLREPLPQHGANDDVRTRLDAFDFVFSRALDMPPRQQLAVFPVLAQATYALDRRQHGAYERLLYDFMAIPPDVIPEGAWVERLTQIASVEQTAEAQMQIHCNETLAEAILDREPRHMGAPIDRLLRASAEHPDARVGRLCFAHLVTGVHADQAHWPSRPGTRTLDALAANLDLSPLRDDLNREISHRSRLLELARRESPACREAVASSIALDLAAQLGPASRHPDKRVAQLLTELLIEAAVSPGSNMHSVTLATLAPCCAHVPEGDQIPLFNEMLRQVPSCKAPRARERAYSSLIDTLDTLSVDYDGKLALRQALREYIGNEPDEAVRERLQDLVDG